MSWVKLEEAIQKLCDISSAMARLNSVFSLFCMEALISCRLEPYDTVVRNGSSSRKVIQALQSCLLDLSSDTVLHGMTHASLYRRDA